MVRSPGLAMGVLILSCLGAGCAPQLVSPYSADLQHRASDVVAEVTAWEAERVRDGHAVKADPQEADIKATLAKWHGDVSAMIGIAAGLDPGTQDCSKTAGKAVALVSSLLAAGVAANQQDATAASAASEAAGHGCETAIVLRVDGDLDQMEMRLDDYCGPASTAGRCSAMFGATIVGGRKVASNGIAVGDLVHDLQTIVYIETRKATTLGKT